MKHNKILIAILLIICIAFGLWGCSGMQPEETVPTYTVRFFVGETLHSQQAVTAGDCPVEEIAEAVGAVFRGWQNSDGEAVDVTAAPITADTDYTAILHPVLDQHVPYLFADQAGLTNPGDPLSKNDLMKALNALAGEEAKRHFPTLLSGSEPASCDQVRKTLMSFFTAEAVGSALPDSGAAQVSRWEFAMAMNLLLERDTEQVILSAETQLPPDLFRGQTGTYDMLEAVVPHTTGAGGAAWREMDIPQLQPGFMNVDGWLYYVQEDGKFLRDGDVGTLHFGADGRYTCGDADLDVMVAQILAQLIVENPEADRLQLLRQCQIYCRDTFEYLRRSPYKFGATGWEIEDAKNMITKGRGNCYSFAAVFWALARGLGYEAYAISGTCLKDEQPHSWVMIEFDGEEYFFDPEWEWAYHDRGVYDKEMFMLTLKKAKNWGYKWTPHW